MFRSVDASKGHRVVTRTPGHYREHSTRSGGSAIAQWFSDAAVAHEGFTVELVDIADYDLPVLDEPNQANLRKYTKQHTMRWSATISRGDCFVFVIPGYNHSFNAATENALDFLFHEWRDKPAGILRYGGAALGTRAAQALKPVLASLKISHAGDVVVSLHTVPVKDGVFAGNKPLVRSANSLLDELAIMAPILIERRQRPSANQRTYARG